MLRGHEVYRTSHASGLALEETKSEAEPKTGGAKMKRTHNTQTQVNDSAVDHIPAGTFFGGDEIPPGTFHGGDEIPPGTFHGGDEIPPGTFHGGDEIPPGTFHGPTL